MPPYAKHLETSTQRTGSEYQQRHDWLDNYPDHKAARHDLATLSENRAYVKETWGTKMAEELGLEEEIRQIIFKHIRCGLTAPEAEELGLPVRDYILRTPEEKIVIYADRMVDIYTDGIVPDANKTMAENKFGEILKSYAKYGKNPATLQRYLAMHDEIQSWMS